jgi:hypothetical protein
LKACRRANSSKLQNRTDVRFWHKADMTIALINVRFRGYADIARVRLNVAY